MEKKDFISALDQLRDVLSTKDAYPGHVDFINHCKDLYLSGDFSASEVRSNLAGQIVLGFYYVSQMARDFMLKLDCVRVDDMLDVMNNMKPLL